MGSRISSRRARMANNDENVPVHGVDDTAEEAGHNYVTAGNGTNGSNPSDSNTHNADEALDVNFNRLLAYIVRSQGGVNVRFYHDHEDNEAADDDSDSDFTYYGYDGDKGMRPKCTPSTDCCPDTSSLQANELVDEIQLLTGLSLGRNSVNSSVSRLLLQREIGVIGDQQFRHADKRHISCSFLPNKKEVVAQYNQKAFCGIYSKEGDVFLSACQDRKLRIYDVSRGRFKLLRVIVARDVGWSILDTVFTADGLYLLYSSWNECVFLCNIFGEDEKHDALPMMPQTEHSFCLFSIVCSYDNRNILGGANDGCLYVYDRELNERTSRIDAHDDDINAVAFGDLTSHIVISGGDDGLLKVWDRRMLNESYPTPVGVFAGHTDGITFIDSKGDGRYFISNCKDQSIKLWDIRRFSSEKAQLATKNEVSRQHWDYRWQQVPKKVKDSKKKVEGDTSVMTYRGHCVLNTLIRCRFSPEYSTGQKFIITACASGSVLIYDVLTGKVVRKLDGHSACVRDVSWHPYEDSIMTTSWDGTVGRWQYEGRPDDEDDKKVHSGRSNEADGQGEEGGETQRRRLSVGSIAQRLRSRILGLY